MFETNGEAEGFRYAVTACAASEVERSLMLSPVERDARGGGRVSSDFFCLGVFAESS